MIFSNTDQVIQDSIQKLKSINSDELEKQKIMYTRLSLSDDPDAVKMKEQLEKSVELMGFPAGTDISVLFNGMTETIEKLRQVVDY